MAAPASPWPPNARDHAKTIAKHSRDPLPNATRKRRASKGSNGLMCDGDNQERRHRDVIGEVYQGVRKVAPDTTRAAGEPAGHNHRKHRQNEIGHLHCLQAERVALSGTVLSPSNNVHAEAIGRERVLSGRQISSGRPLRSRGARTIVRPAFRRASPQPCGALGRSQAVRQRILIPPYGGSNPPAPASHLRFLYQHVAFDCGLAAQG
jgi:hypothetical protein